MKARTVLIKHILDNSFAERIDSRHIVAGKRQTGKTTAGILGSIFKGLESCNSKYRILIICPTYMQELSIQNIIFRLSEVDRRVEYRKQGHSIWLNVDEDIVFEIDLISSNSLISVRGRDYYDFGIIEELNYCRNWKECLGNMTMMTKDFIMISEAVL